MSLNREYDLLYLAVRLSLLLKVKLHTSCISFTLKVSREHHLFWNDNDACLTLQGLFDSTDWNMFIEASADTDELTDAVTSWTSCCESIVIPAKNVMVYPNSKPWVTKSLKTLLNNKNNAFREGNALELHNLQKEIKREVRAGKMRYKDK